MVQGAVDEPQQAAVVDAAAAAAVDTQDQKLVGCGVEGAVNQPRGGRGGDDGESGGADGQRASKQSGRDCV